MNTYRYITTLLLAFCSFNLSASQQTHELLPKFFEKQKTANHYSFAVHPLHNPTRLYKVFNPLVQYLNKNTPNAVFNLEASRDYPTYDKKLSNEQPDFALPNPYQTVEAMKHGYKVFGKMGDDANFRGIILVRKDSHIKNFEDLQNQKISYPAPTALAATMMPQYYIFENAPEVFKSTESVYVGSQESSIMNVLHKKTIAGATWPPPWELLVRQNPEIADELKVIWQTHSLPNNGLVAHKRVPEKLVRHVQNLLTNLHKTEEGKKILKGMYLSKFEKADATTYKSVSNFITNFTQQIRDPKEP